MKKNTKDLLKSILACDESMTDTERAETLERLTMHGPAPQEPERLLTFKEAGTMLSVHEKTVWGMVRRRILNVVPITSRARRVRLSEIKKLMEEGVTVNRSYCPTREKAS